MFTLRLQSLGLVIGVVACLSPARGEVKTWDGKHSIDQIEVSVVYYLPRDREPLPDWKDRVAYFCRRIERFHAREYHGQSNLKTVLRPEPLRSARTTQQLRAGDGDFIFFQTLNEADAALKFAQGERKAFPILLVLSDINWRPLDDFWRVMPAESGKWEFEGNYGGGRHFPGAESGGARATYLADRGVGWGLVSADGWRVPYSGSDCVVYHEGVGHTVGLPHPEPGNGSVMSQGQYKGWISESWLDDAQKLRLGWKKPEAAAKPSDLFSVFKALPDPLVPKPGEPVALQLTWPADAKPKSLRVRLQTDVWGPWVEVATQEKFERVALGSFDRATPLSYRVDAVLEDGQEAEIWGYFQVRAEPNQPPYPPLSPSNTGETAQAGEKPIAKRTGLKDEIDLLILVDVEKDKVAGEWTREGTQVISPKQFGARLEIPFQPPEEYELSVIAEPLDEPKGLILGQRLGEQRFLTLVSYAAGGGEPWNALENIDGKNVGRNATSLRRTMLAKDRPSQIICTVRKQSITVACDGQELISWQGDPKQLSLGDYWKTPHESALFLGAYDCRIRFSRVTLLPLSGTGKKLRQ